MKLAIVVQRYGAAVDLAWHEPSRDGDERNHHMHAMFTVRRIDEKGFAARKDNPLDSPKTSGEELKAMRGAFAGDVEEWRRDIDAGDRARRDTACNLKAGGPCAAADIKHGFIALERIARQNICCAFELERISRAIIYRRVPKIFAVGMVFE